MDGVPMSIQDAFFAYAKSKISFSHKVLFDCLQKASDYCHLKQPLFGMTDVTTVRRVQQAVSEGRLLRYQYKNDAQKIRVVTLIYYQFVKSLSEETKKMAVSNARSSESSFTELKAPNKIGSTETIDRPVKKEVPDSTRSVTNKSLSKDVNKQSDEEWIISVLKGSGFIFCDKRPVNGCLWIEDSPDLQDFVKECKLHGYRMNYKPDGCRVYPNKAVWWTKDKPELQIQQVLPLDLIAEQTSSISPKTPKFRTIIEAVYFVLREATQPLTFPEINDAILNRELYCFNTSESINMIRHAVYTHCLTTKQRIANGEEVIIQIKNDGLNKYQIMNADDASRYLYGVSLYDKKTDIETSKPMEQVHTSGNERIITEAEKIVEKADLDGITMDELAKQLNSTVGAATKTVANTKNIIIIDGRLVHKNAFMDWEENADVLEGILDKLMSKNNGYVSAEQLFDYARIDMQMFINDHNMGTPRKIYDMAEHLFDKECYHGKRYSFSGKSHISRKEEAVTTKLDIIRKFARDNGGIFTMRELEDYLTSIGVKNDNLRQQMKLYDQPIFLYIDEGTFITAESMGLNASFLEIISIALKRLFCDGGDHVVLRDIQASWFNLLPALPHGKEWTPLLLQSVLRFFSKECGAHTIYGLENQAGDTLHAMVVSNRSEIQTFGDAVIAMLLDDGISQRKFEEEELRHKLVDRGMIAGNELIWNLPKALPNDGRFAWNSDGHYVTINI